MKSENTYCSNKECPLSKLCLRQLLYKNGAHGQPMVGKWVQKFKCDLDNPQYFVENKNQN